MVSGAATNTPTSHQPHRLHVTPIGRHPARLSLGALVPPRPARLCDEDRDIVSNSRTQTSAALADPTHVADGGPQRADERVVLE
jgi:hypothetical protein